jgi:hypothetical protein
MGRHISGREAIFMTVENEKRGAKTAIMVCPATVVDFLRDELAGGALGVAELEAKARAAGLLAESQHITHSKLFKRAKKSLSIRSVRSGFGSRGEWVWVLDQQPPQANTDGTGQALVLPASVSADANSDLKMEASAEDVLAGARSASHVPLDWIEGVAALDHRSRPIDVPAHRWRQFLADCKNFLTTNEHWAERAATLGWDAHSIFGCRRNRPLEHLGSAGLLWVISGGRLLELHRDWAVIELAANGSRRVFDRRRLDAAKVTLPWVGLASTRA